MDDMKLFAKNEKELKTLIQTLRIYSQDIRMEFGIEKSDMLAIKSGKQHMTEGMKIPNEERIRTIGEKETYKYLGIFSQVFEGFLQVEIKEKFLRISQENEQAT